MILRNILRGNGSVMSVRFSLISILENILITDSFKQFAMTKFLDEMINLMKREEINFLFYPQWRKCLMTPS